MQIPEALTYALTLLLACAATWGGSHWWYGRKLQAALHKIEKLNHTRVLCDQHTAQVRRQIEQLNRELTSYRAREQWAPTPPPPPAAAPPVMPAPAPTPPARSSAADLARLLEAGDHWQATQQQAGRGWQTTQQADDGWQATQQTLDRPGSGRSAAVAHGFADTRPM